MQLLLLRHADAATMAASDDLRALSDKGRGQAKRMGKFCREHDLCPDIILTSPLRRAMETAQYVAAATDCETVEAGFLASGMTPAQALEELRSYTRFDRILIVGHEPDFSLLVASLLALPAASKLRIRKAALAGLEVESFRPGGGMLEFLIPAKLV